MIDAFRFLTQCRTNGEFRKRMYGGPTDAEGEGFARRVEAAGYAFTAAEAEDALRSLILRAEDEYEAEEIKELGQWYRFMAEANGADAQPAGAEGGCSPSACAACSLCR